MHLPHNTKMLSINFVKLEPLITILKHVMLITRRQNSLLVNSSLQLVLKILIAKAHIAAQVHALAHLTPKAYNFV